MMSNALDPNFDSITVKVEHPEYGPMETSTTASELSTMRLFSDEPVNNYIPFKNDVYHKLLTEESVIDFIESSLDNFLVNCNDKNEKLTKGAERQRIYRLNETQAQRERRLALARQYIKKRRDNETDIERYERLKKQRERIRALRQTRKLNPEVDQIRRQAEAERMKMRRANETPHQRMRRLEKSRMYSRRRRENQIYRSLENEKNKLAHQNRRMNISFRVQERQRDRIRRRNQRRMEFAQFENIPEPLCSLEVCLT